MASSKKKSSQSSSSKSQLRDFIIITVIIGIIMLLSFSLARLLRRYHYAKNLSESSLQKHEELTRDLENLKQTFEIISTQKGERQLIREQLHAPDPGEELIIIVPEENTQRGE